MNQKIKDFLKLRDNKITILDNQIEKTKNILNLRMDEFTKSLSDSLSDEELKLEKVSKKISNSMKAQEKKITESSVTILGIFSAVVLTFNGTFVFSSSMLENIGAASAYRIAFVALLVGLVLLNVIFGLFYFIIRLVKNSKAEVKTTLRPLWLSNAIFIILLIVTFFCWEIGAVESRNKRIIEELSSTLSYSEEIDKNAYKYL